MDLAGTIAALQTILDAAKLMKRFPVGFTELLWLVQAIGYCLYVELLAEHAQELTAKKLNTPELLAPHTRIDALRNVLYRVEYARNRWGAEDHLFTEGDLDFILLAHKILIECDTSLR